MKKWVILSAVFTAAAFSASAWIYCVGYDKLPDRLPIHWDIRGQPDGWVPKEEIFKSFFLVPSIMAGMVVLTLILPWLSPQHFDVDRFRNTYGYVMMLIIVLLGYIHLLILYGSLHPDGFDMFRWMLGGILVVLALVGNVLGQIQRNFWIGVRTPWTLANERVWIETHRLTAWVMVAASLGGLIALVCRAPMLAIFIGFMTIIVVIPIGYSLLLYKRLERQGKL
jgi:uncharacterized membrane protein